MTEGQRSCAYETCDRVPHKTSSDGRCIFHAKAEDKTIEDFRQALEKSLSKLKEVKDAVYDFVGFVFVGDINFEEDFGLNVFEEADFSDATFKGDAFFGWATFKGRASFDNATFEGYASFDNATFEGYASFPHAKFEGEVSFGLITFEGGAFFRDATFKGDANFGHITFKGDANFGHITFKGDASFRNTTFKGHVWFDNATYKGYASFPYAKFEGEVSFEYAIYKGRASFDNATFEGNASFGYAIFEGSASFGYATLKYIEFDSARFRETASIAPRFVSVGISFADATIENIVISPLHLKEEAQIDFTGARLRNTNIRREDVEGHIKQEKSEHYGEARDIYMLLKNNFRTIGRYDDESWSFLQEKEMERKNFCCPIKELQVKELGEKWKNRGLKDCFYPVIFYSGRIAKYLWDFWLPTSWKNIKELAFRRTKSFRRPLACVRAEFKNLVSSMTMNEEEKSRRKLDLSWKEILKALLFYLQSPRYKSAWKYFKSTFLKWLYGWGEKPWFIFIWCGITIFIFSGLYCLIGDITLATDATIVKSYGTKLYFSGITFTTLGFGGYSPMGGAKVLAFIESFLGIFSIALFVYSFARRTAGR